MKRIVFLPLREQLMRAGTFRRNFRDELETTKVREGEDAFASKRDACATQISDIAASI